MSETIKSFDQEDIEELLEGAIYWPDVLELMKSYRRTHDDCEGRREECITVMFGVDSDAYCSQDIGQLEFEEIRRIENEKFYQPDLPGFAEFFKRDDDDYYVDCLFPLQLVRFRNYAGGGRSQRVYNALRILAFAIYLDNQDDPIANPDHETES